MSASKLLTVNPNESIKSNVLSLIKTVNPAFATVTTDQFNIATVAGPTKADGSGITYNDIIINYANGKIMRYKANSTLTITGIEFRGLAGTGDFQYLRISLDGFSEAPDVVGTLTKPITLRSMNNSINMLPMSDVSKVYSILKSVANTLKPNATLDISPTSTQKVTYDSKQLTIHNLLAKYMNVHPDAVTFQITASTVPDLASADALETVGAEDHYVVTIKVTPTTEGNYLYTGTTTVYLQP